MCAAACTLRHCLRREWSYQLRGSGAGHVISFGVMGRDQTRMLICAVASLFLILMGAVMMDWYQLAFGGSSAADRCAVDLRTVRGCGGRVCGNRSLSLLPGMFPTLAAVTLWSSLGFAMLVTFQT